MKLSIATILASSLLLAGPLSALPSDAHGIVAADLSLDGLHDWVASPDANLCGISTLKRVTNPAVVDYDALLAATPQLIEMDQKGIKPDSVEGRALREAARNLIVRKAQSVQKNGGYCGIWKAIENRDGRAIDDVTSEVIALF